MRLRFDESKTPYYAAKYLEDELGYDNPVESVVDEVKGRGYLGRVDILVSPIWQRLGESDKN